jgi:NifU-like protein
MADTIETRTTPIEEGALMPGSLCFESEPWTPFYMAGEIIRESRKAAGKQSKYESEDITAHSDIVLDHSDHPCDVGSLPKDDPNVGTGLVGAPECGSVLELQLRIKSRTQVIKEAEFKTFGCGSEIAKFSLTTEWVKGKTSRKHWPSRTRISSASLDFPRSTLLDATRYPGIGGRLHLVGGPIL